jgi:hypothetical protein
MTKPTTARTPSVFALNAEVVGLGSGVVTNRRIPTGDCWSARLVGERAASSRKATRYSRTCRGPSRDGTAKSTFVAFGGSDPRAMKLSARLSYRRGVANLQRVAQLQLSPREVVVQAAPGDQRGVRPPFGDPAVLEHEDHVGVADGAQAMGDGR